MSGMILFVQKNHVARLSMHDDRRADKIRSAQSMRFTFHFFKYVGTFYNFVVPDKVMIVLPQNYT